VSTLILTTTVSIAHPINSLATHNVTIFNLAFNPQNLTIDVGDTISWQNNDPLIYTLWFTKVSDGSTYLLSDPILPGNTWSWTFNEPVTLQYYSFERLWITGFINVQGAVTPIAGTAGITGYKLVFKEEVSNLLASPATIDYYFSLDSVDKWSGTAWIATPLAGSSPIVYGYIIPPLSTVTLYWTYVLPTSGPNAVFFCNWTKVDFSFHWTYGGTNFQSSYLDTKLHVHPADIATGTVNPPYYGSDLIVNVKDVTPISLNWQKIVPPGTDPTSALARADINGDGIVNVKDVTPISLNWQKGWTNTPPPG